MKIAFVTPAYPPHQGGLEIVTELLVEALRERDNTVEVYAPPGIKHSWNVFGGSHLVGRIGSVPDIFHVQQCDLSVRYTALLKQKYPHVPVVTTIHSMFRFDPSGYCRVRLSPIEPLRQILRIVPGKYFENESICASDYIIVPSKTMEFICKEIREDSLVRTIPNGINLRQFSQKEDMALGSGHPVILCSGRIFAEKGQLTLIEALPEVLAHVDATVCFVGGNDPVYYQNLLDLAVENNVEKNIYFAGPRPYAEMPGIYRGADIVVAPSLSETFGMAILENMAMGNIVVASRVGAVPDLIDSEVNGMLVEPRDPHALAQAIIRGLTDKSLRRRIWENAPRKAAMFDIRKTAEEVEKIYQSVL